MYFQLIIFIISVLGLYIFKETGSDARRYLMRKKYVALIMFLFIIQSGFRNLAIGADTYAYAIKFQEDSNESWQYFFSNFGDIKDVGYHILTKFFSTIINDFRIFLIAIACFFFYALGRIFIKYLNSSYDVLIAISLYQCLFYSFFSITGLRQTIATGFLLILIPYFLEKKYIHTTILFVCAFLMHKSALIFFIFFILSKFKRSKYVLMIAFALFIPMFSWQSGFGKIIEGTMMDSYAHYMEQEFTSGAFTFMAFILLLGFFTFIKVDKIINGYNYIFINALAVAILLTPLLALDPNNQRIVQYFSIFSLLVLPNVCNAYELNKGNSKILHMIIFTIFAYYILSRNLEYKFFWQDMVFENEEDTFILNDDIL